MSCMEFQRELNADPRRLSAVARGHAEACADCARRMVEQFKLDARLDDLLQITPPTGMEDRILLATRIGQQKRLRLVAMAASLVLGVAVALSVNMLPQSSANRDLIALAVEHVLAEPEHLVETQTVDMAALNRLLAQVGAHTQEVLPVTYANDCPLPNGKGGHVVLATPHGRVTLMLMPHGKTDAMLRRTVDHLLVEVHAAQRGSYSLVAPNEQAMVDAKSLLSRTLKWT